MSMLLASDTSWMFEFFREKRFRDLRNLGSLENLRAKDL